VGEGGGGEQIMSMAISPPLAIQARDDERALALLAAGDERAAVNLYREHGRELYRFIARRVNGPTEDIEEILQDTMLAAVANAGSFRRECTIRTWLCSIAMKQILQRSRTALRKKRIPASQTCSLDESMLEWLQVSAGACPDRSADFANDLAVKEGVRQVMAALEDSYREVLLLRYVEDFSIREIARVCGKSERAVEGLLRRARLRAREIGAQYL
jgi:RNA polymerase sigma-70 factor, ECF subfamily